MQTLETVKYNILPKGKIKAHVIAVCEKEWDTPDFPQYGDDLYKSVWKLETVQVNKIKLRPELLKQKKFLKSLALRVIKQKELYSKKTPIPPLILRGGDLLIFDGYARYHLFKERGIKKCLAYIGRR